MNRRFVIINIINHQPICSFETMEQAQEAAINITKCDPKLTVTIEWY